MISGSSIDTHWDGKDGSGDSNGVDESRELAHGGPFYLEEERSDQNQQRQGEV
jgi:hypothetical protein